MTWSIGTTGGKRREARRQARRDARKASTNAKKDELKSLKDQMNPREQFVGGTADENKKVMHDYQAGRDKGEQTAYKAASDAKTAASNAGVENEKSKQKFGDLYAAQEGIAGKNAAAAGKASIQGDQAWGDYGKSQSNYQAGRSGLQNDASFLENSAQNMVSNYQKTDEMRRTADLEAAQRQALSTARSSGGGALAIRSALQSQGAANATAAGQAGITRAGETNQLLGMQNEAMQAAAGVRGNLSGQDLSSAGQSAGIAQGMGGLALNANQAQSANYDAAAQAAGAQAGLTQADVNNRLNVAQLGATVGGQFRSTDTAAGVQTRDLQAQIDQANEMARREAAANQYIDLKNQPSAKQNMFGKAVSWIVDPMNVRGSKSGETSLSSLS